MKKIFYILNNFWRNNNQQKEVALLSSQEISNQSLGKLRVAMLEDP